MFLPRAGQAYAGTNINRRDTTQVVRLFSLTTPPSKLAERLGTVPPGAIFDVLNPDNTLSERVSAIHGMAMAIRGEIEGIGPKNGRILRFRLLETSQKQEPAEKSEVYTSRSTVVTRQNIGTYRQILKNGAGEAVGFCWALSLLRTAGV